MNCNYKVKITDIQTKYKFKVFCTGYDDSEIKEKIDAMYQAWPKATAEGETPTLDNTANATMTIDLKGNTSQEGTPTPEAPVEVDTTTGGQNIAICGKNLFDKNTTNILNANLSNSKINSSANERVAYIKCLPNTTYTLSKIIPSSYIRNTIGTTQTLPAINVTVDNAVYSATSPKTITTNANAQYIVWLYYSTNDPQYTEQQTLDSMQIEKGTTTTPYEAYTGQSYEINLGTMELCKIGDYQDYIYKDNKKWYKYGAIGKVVLDGSENWNNDGGAQGTDYRHNIYYASRMTIPVSIGTNNTYLSNYFTARNVGNDTGELGSFYMSNTWLVFVDKNKVYDLEQWKTWLSTHNTEVYYILATPTTTEITDTTLISQLNALAGAESYSGQTNISQTNDDKPFILTAKALKDLSNL